MKINKTKKNSKQKSIKHIFGNIAFILKRLFQYAPDYVAINSILSLMRAASKILTVLFTKQLYDIYMREGAGLADVFGVVLPFLVFQLVNQITGLLSNYIFIPKSKQRLQYKLQSDLYEKARSIDLACYDDPKFYNSFVWAMTTADKEATVAADRVINTISSIIAFIGVAGVIGTIEPLVIVIIAFCVLFGMLFNYIHGRIGVRYSEEEKPYERRKEYSLRVFYLADYAKEIRMSRVENMILGDYEKALYNQTRVIRKYAKREVFINYLSVFFEDLPMRTGITLIMIWRILGGAISLGDYAAVTESIWTIFSSLSAIVRCIPEFAVSSLYIDKYRAFVEYKNKIVSGTESLPSFKSLKISGLKYKYNGCKDETICGVDFEIKRGERIAIVGCNGAGKTTLIKLIMRLYDPTQGCIKYNGRDISSFDLNDYRKKFGVIFQDFKVYAATIAENVMGDEYKPEDEQIVLDALRRATFGAKLDKLENGIYSNLTREFDENGVNLSGGEAQKVAIARAFARDCEIIIMDEPSSALDPISEYELNHSIKDNAGDKTVIFISHRLSTTRMADRIYMFEDGRVIEQGTHENLIKQGGKYARMFELQAGKYY